MDRLTCEDSQLSGLLRTMAKLEKENDKPLYSDLCIRSAELIERLEMIIETSTLKHEMWIPEKNEYPERDSYYCSGCGKRPLFDWYSNEVLSDYCPHCGAKMSKE